MCTFLKILLRPRHTLPFLFKAHSLILPLIFTAFTLLYAGCGSKSEEQEEEDNLELNENVDTTGDDGNFTLTMIQGDKVFGAALRNGKDTAHVVADIRGDGNEWDIRCYRDANKKVILSFSDGKSNGKLSDPFEGLNAKGELPSGYTVEIAAAHITDSKVLDILCVVGDGSKMVNMTVYKNTPQSQNAFTRVGALEGESFFLITRSKTIEAPFGAKGLPRTYSWNGSSFEELQDQAF